MTKETIQPLVDTLNELLKRSPYTIYSWSTAFYPVDASFVEHPTLPVQPIPYSPEHYVTTNLSILNSLFSEYGVYLVSVWSEPNENGKRTLLKYDVMGESEMTEE